LNKKTVEQINDMDDDLDFDDEFMREYMAKRKGDLVEKAKRSR
jgi:hypothetical protein